MLATYPQYSPQALMATPFGATLFAPPGLHAANSFFGPEPGPGVNTIRVRSLGEFYPNFPGQRLLGWGQQLMRTDPTSGRFSGSGVRIGIIDSGCDTSHPLLRHITQGKDFTAGAAETGWTQDPLAHGTHCAGIINATNT